MPGKQTSKNISHLLTKPRSYKHKPIEDISDGINFDLQANECQNLYQTIENLQMIVDQMTGWDEIDSTWYDDRHQALINGCYDHLPNIRDNDAERAWAEDTSKRWKVGVYHHQEHGLVWTAWNLRHQEAGRWHSGSDEHSQVALTVGSLLNEILTLSSIHKAFDHSKSKALNEWNKEQNWESKHQETYSLKNRF